MVSSECASVPETGDPLLDEQHRRIRRLLDDAVACEGHADEYLHVLDRLMRHVDFHFTTEEQLMLRCGYEGRAAQEHLDSHRRLRDLARDAVLAYRAGRPDTEAAIVALLRNEWLAEHVFVHDQKFAEFVREKGLHAELPTLISGSTRPRFVRETAPRSHAGASEEADPRHSVA
jgi:hemerythrin-like metal-binding protein